MFCFTHSNNPTMKKLITFSSGVKTCVILSISLSVYYLGILGFVGFSFSFLFIFLMVQNSCWFCVLLPINLLFLIIQCKHTFLYHYMKTRCHPSTSTKMLNISSYCSLWVEMNGTIWNWWYLSIFFMAIAYSSTRIYVQVPYKVSIYSTSTLHPPLYWTLYNYSYFV